MKSTTNTAEVMATRESKVSYRRVGESLWPAPDNNQVDGTKAAQVANDDSGSSDTSDIFARALSFVGIGEVRQLCFLASII